MIDAPETPEWLKFRVWRDYSHGSQFDIAVELATNEATSHTLASETLNTTHLNTAEKFNEAIHQAQHRLLQKIELVAEQSKWIAAFQ